MAAWSWKKLPFAAQGLETRGLEIEEGRALEAQRRGHHVQQGDALALAGSWPDADLLVMNPPYGALALPFLEAALAWREKARHRRVCSLFHLSFLDPMGGRARLFSRNPPDTLHLKRRPKFGLAGTNPIGSAWYCWPTAALSRFESLNLWPKEEP